MAGADKESGAAAAQLPHCRVGILCAVLHTHSGGGATAAASVAASVAAAAAAAAAAAVAARFVCLARDVVTIPTNTSTAVEVAALLCASTRLAAAAAIATTIAIIDTAAA